MTAERAHMGIVPFCPQCGEPAMFMRRAESVGDEVPIHCSSVRCGWHGYGPTTIPIPRNPPELPRRILKGEIPPEGMSDADYRKFREPESRGNT